MCDKRLARLLEKGYSTRRAAKVLGCSHMTVAYRAEQLGLRPPAPNRVYKCGVCGNTDPANFFPLKPSLCKGCQAVKIRDRGRVTRRTLVKQKGGRCERCGYDRCIAALDFHHPDPAVKEPNFGSYRVLNLAKAVEMTKDCELLCANCHREAHHERNFG